MITRCDDRRAVAKFSKFGHSDGGVSEICVPDAVWLINASANRPLLAFKTQEITCILKIGRHLQCVYFRL